MPDKGSMYYPRVQHYRELLDSLPMDAYTHGCILHPELTVDSMIPAYATTRIRSQIGNTESELKKLAEENPDLQEAYIAKQKRLKSKLLDHDNVKYLKKILDELEKVLDQVETELQRRNEETPEEGRQPWLCGESFTLADVSLAVTLHRLKFLGFARRNWGNGKRPNLETYYERVLKRKTFNKFPQLGDACEISLLWTFVSSPWGSGLIQPFLARKWKSAYRGYLSPSGRDNPRVSHEQPWNCIIHSLCSGKNFHGDRKIQIPWSWPEGSWGIVLDLWLEVCIEHDELRFQQTTKAFWIASDWLCKTGKECTDFFMNRKQSYLGNDFLMVK
ncbi:ganglioside-induced differentiation-associated protein 1 isoform X3 [Neovison vison]|nr:ganglioside-induced differentiation-associated protein 1 isoform X3 [Neogale vison]